MNGAQLFQEMSNRIQRLDVEIDQLNQRISAGLTALDQETRSLAQGDLAGAIQSDQQADSLPVPARQPLQARRQRLSTNLEELAKLESQLAEAVSNEREARAAHENAAGHASAATESVLAEVWSSPENAPLQKELAEKEEVFKAAAARANEASQEKEAKARAYTDDPIFSYLYQRKFGGPGYQSRGLVQRMDSWVASVSNYREAAYNFEILTQLPIFLKKHADEIFAELTNVREKASALEQSHLAAAQIDQHRTRETEAKEVAEKAAMAVTNLKSQIAQHQSIAQRFNDYQDPEYRSLLDQLANHYKNNPSAEIRQAQEELNQWVMERNGKATQREQLQQAQINFQKAGYNSPAVVYRGGSDPMALLTGFMLGQLAFDAFQRSMSTDFSPPSGPFTGENRWDSGGGDFGGDSGGGGFDDDGGFGGDSGGGGFDDNSSF